MRVFFKKYRHKQENKFLDFFKGESRRRGSFLFYSEIFKKNSPLQTLRHIVHIKRNGDG